MTAKERFARFGKLTWQAGEAGDPCWYARLGGNELRARALAADVWIVGVRNGAMYETTAVGKSFPNASHRAEEVLS